MYGIFFFWLIFPFSLHMVLLSKGQEMITQSSLGALQRDAHVAQSNLVLVRARGSCPLLQESRDFDGRNASHNAQCIFTETAFK